MRVTIAEPNVAGQNVIILNQMTHRANSTMDLVMSSSKILSVQKSDIIEDKAFYSVKFSLKTFLESTARSVYVSVSLSFRLVSW